MVDRNALNKPEPGRKYFSVEEANRALIYLRPICEQMKGSYGQVMVMRKNLEVCGSYWREDLEDGLERCMDQLTELVNEVNHVGVEIKDFEKGLLDFPAVHEGREIYLCWCLEEPSIKYWHEINQGKRDRKEVGYLKKQIAS